MSLEFKKETDKEHVETLQSEIVHAVWRSRIACVGSRAAFEVWTHFVGSGSDIEVKIEDKRGKAIEKITGKVFGDYFGGFLVVPEDAREELRFTAKLPGHGLEKQSEAVRLIRVWNLQWDREEARRDDVVTLSAEIEGLPEGTEIMFYVYEHDQDGAHDFITKFPGTVSGGKAEAEWVYEYHEDTDDIPTEGELQPSGRHYNYPEYFFKVNSEGCNTRSELLRFKDWLEIELVDDEGNPVPDEEYILRLPDGTEKKGTLDANGCAREEEIPPGRIVVLFSNIERFQKVVRDQISESTVRGNIRSASGNRNRFRLEPFIFSD